MKATLILCEAATQHPDGTFSMLRAGIDRVGSPNEPVPFNGTLVTRIQGEITDQGNHSFDLKCMNQDGALVLPPLTGRFAVQAGGGFVSLMIGLGMLFPKFGVYVFSLRIDNHLHGEWKIRTELTPAQQQGETRS